MPTLFGLTLFVSATLLFLVQPMVGKMVLPLLGGTPAVWNTCMVFYQALLLLGYYYAHRTTTALPTRRQVAVHAGLLLVGVGALTVAAALSAERSPVPILKSMAPQGSDLPFFGVLLLLAAAIGLPFFTVSTTAPLLQKWFSETGHPSAKDPYFLYAASNFGSLLALVAYPFVVEPNLKLVNQAWLWAAGFLGLTVMLLVCGRAVLNAPPPRKPDPRSKKAPAVEPPPPHWSTKLRWLLLAAVPSSLMLSVTTSVTTDMLSMPLLWVIPLALYLLTFIIVFSKSTPAWVHLASTLATPVLILLVVFMRGAEPIGNLDTSDSPMLVRLFVKALPFLTSFFVALTCHGELARTRPSSKHLTEFYLLMSVGGVIGGLFNALFAPVVFTFVSEYPISLVAACCLLPRLSALTDPTAPPEPRRLTVWDFATPLFFFAAARFLSAYYTDIADWCGWLIRTLEIQLNPKTAATIIAFGLTTLASYFLVERPLRFGACVGAIWLGTFLTFMMNERKVDPAYRNVYTRSFFGTLKVEPGPRYTRLVHGTTLHGLQRRNPLQQSILQGLSPLGADGPLSLIAPSAIAHPHWEYPGREPLSYYHRTGPVGHMFERFAERNRARPGANTDVACIGLGTGTLSAYGRPGQKMTFFEIDWKVRRLVASDPEHPEDRVYFTYVDEARRQGVEIEFLMGDARLSLEQVPDRKWGFMLVDAFSSDAIPAHLLTKQSLELYFNRLEADGIVALHISNRYLDLEPVVERIARELGYEARVMKDNVSGAEELYTGKLSSTWIAVARTTDGLGSLTDDPERWKPLQSNPKVGLWTDDFTPIKNILQGDANPFGD